MLWGTLHAPLARFNLPIGVLHFQFMGNGIYGKTVFQDQLPTPLAQLPEVMKECYHCLQALWNFTQTVTFSRVFQVSMWLLRKCFWSEQCKTCYKDQKKKKTKQKDHNYTYIWQSYRLHDKSLCPHQRTHLLCESVAVALHNFFHIYFQKVHWALNFTQGGGHIFIIRVSGTIQVTKPVNWG